MRLSNFFLLTVYFVILFCDGVIPQKLRRYKVCNGYKCRRFRSYTSPEFLFDMDSFVYTGWSPWAGCNRKCVTNRYRACRFPSICGDQMMIHEEAFCYRRGTHCEFIFHNSRRDFFPNDSDYLDQDQSVGFQSNEKSSEILTNIPNPNPTPATSINLNTGANRNRRRHQNITTDAARRRLSPTRVPTSSSSSNRYNTTINNAQPRLNRTRTSTDRFSSNRRNDRALIRSTASSQRQCGIARNTEAQNSGFALRILGGKEAAKGRWPWQVAILSRTQEAFCGGTLIAPRWILTAAHCVRRRIHVTIGEHHLHRNEGTEKHYKIDAAFIHPEFDPDTVNNDIALLLLPEPVSVESGLACLPEQNQKLPSPQTICTILGWGKEKHTHIFGTTVLHEGRVPIVSTADCRFTYPYEVTSNMFCAGTKSGRTDSCAGDSGGPILCTHNNRWTVFGVTSFGDGCGRKGKYGIYADVTRYVSWIQRVMQANEYLT